MTLSHLRQGEFNLVNLANNHINDFYEVGISDTIDFLHSEGINTFGGDVPCFREKVSGFILAFCGFNEEEFTNKEMVEIINNQKKDSNKIIVSMHWGYENISEVNESQAKLAHELIDHGADIIIGHHPHVIQPFEIYKNRPIIYSLGNFIFDQTEERNRLGLAIGVFLETEKINLYFYPFRSENFQPQLLDHEDREQFFKKYLPKGLTGVLEIKNGN